MLFRLDALVRQQSQDRLHTGMALRAAEAVAVGLGLVGLGQLRVMSNRTGSIRSSHLERPGRQPVEWSCLSTWEPLPSNLKMASGTLNVRDYGRSKRGCPLNFTKGKLEYRHSAYAQREIIDDGLVRATRIGHSGQKLSHLIRTVQ